MQCLRCLNEEPRYFYQDKEVFYCRKCIAFGRMDVGELPKKKKYKSIRWNKELQLQYPLTKSQLRVSKQMLAYLKQGCNVLVYAAAGAGKTEIAMMALAMYLKEGKKVGVAIARRQVVLEIKDRLQKAFPDLRVIAVCEGYTRITDGDIIVCTMHQLYRYHACFSLLIMDEVDAFPYRGNAILKQIAFHACVGEKIYLTATPDEEMLKDVQKGMLQKVELFIRPHQKPIVVPMVQRGVTAWLWYSLLKMLYAHKKENKQLLLFVPTIALAKQMRCILRLLFSCCVCTSQTQAKDEVIKDFREQKYLFLLCTTVLERGITIENINVIVWRGDHMVFNEASLIQIVGRVGRTMNCPSGEAVIFCGKKNNEIQKCIDAIKHMNQSIKEEQANE